MISHAECSHPSTPGARAKCRRARANGQEVKTTERVSVATPKETGRERNRGTTPRDRDLQCDVCGVERIMWRGCDVLTGLLLYVGERCFYYVKEGDPILVDRRA